MAKLLVSVRSAVEARAAVAGGAAIIDVKEPLHGPLGRAEAEVAHQVRCVVDERVLVSVALGELNNWCHPRSLELGRWAGIGVAYVKLGLSCAQSGWRDQWRTIRQQLAAISSQTGSASPGWVAVVYADWELARAPQPDDVILETLEADECCGVLIDTWEKTKPSPLDPSWKPLADSIRETGRFLALAGRIDVDAIERLSSLEPDIIAVRGAACTDGDRLGMVDADRVARLVEAAARVATRSRANYDGSGAGQNRQDGRAAGNAIVASVEEGPGKVGDTIGRR
jgi:uncharacterized protein (UPF0264 family)